MANSVAGKLTIIPQTIRFILDSYPLKFFQPKNITNTLKLFADWQGKQSDKSEKKAKAKKGGETSKGESV